MTIPANHMAPTQNNAPGIDVCSGPALTRAERLAQEAARFAPRPTAKRVETTPGPAAAE